MSQACTNTIHLADISHTQKIILASESGAMAFTYCLTMIPLFVNFYRFVYEQQRYKLITVAIFYVFATALIFLRVTALTMLALDMTAITHNHSFHTIYALSRSATLCKYIVLL